MASANIFLDKARSRDGGHPVCIRICHLRKQWMITLKVSACVKDYDKAINNKGVLNENQRRLRETMFESRDKAQRILDGLSVITKENFNHAYYSEVDIVKAASLLDIESQFTLYMEELKEAGSIKSSEVYRNALRTLLAYRGNVNLQDIDHQYLKRYEAYMKANGNGLSTTSMYLRCLRAIFNRAIKAKRINRKYYAFEDYPVYSGSKSKEVLYPKDVEAFYNYVPATEAGDRCKRFWFFSFLANGMNPKDIFELRWKDLKGDRLSFKRCKTMKTRKDAEDIVLYLHPYAMDIIRDYGRKQSKDGYIFPLFNGCDTEMDKFTALKTWKRQTNRILNRMAKHLGFDELNMSLARHSMATSLAMKNINVSIISRMMGHSRLETTTHYLHSLPDEAMRDINIGMLDFKSSKLKAV